MKRCLKVCAWAFAAVLTASATAFAQAPIVAQVPLKDTLIPQFVQELPRLVLPGGAATSGIPVVTGAAVDISMCEFQAGILPPGTPVVGAVPGVAPKTWVWGYQNSPACATPGGSYIGPVVLATRGTPTEVTYTNLLGDAATSKVLAYQQSTDQTLRWADPFSLQRDGMFLNPYPGIPVGPPWALDTFEVNDCNLAAKTLAFGALLPAPCADNYGFLVDAALGRVPYATMAPIPAAPHLHGGEIPAALDGGPDAWWTSNGIFGHGYYSKGGTGDALLGKAVYTYPNVQDAAPTWFHDHVLGATRLNVYAGIAGAYYQIDPAMNPTGHPVGMMNGASAVPLGPPSAELLIPLVIQDRMFDTSGQLLFPNVGLNPEHPLWVPEFVGDVIVVNGKAWPKVTVEPKRYRFLVLNGSNARAYELFLVNPVTGVKGPAIWVIGNDQGYLDAPVAISPKAKKPNNKLTVMPGERYEIIVDFAGLAPGTTLELRNTAQTPYPGGIPVKGSTTGKIVRFQVSACTSGFCGAGDVSFNPARPGATLRPAGLRIVRLADPLTGQPLATVQKTRQLTVNEFVGAGGPLEVLVNNTTYLGAEAGAAARPDFTGITSKWNTTYYSELPYEGETEIWEIVNITADAHPIHPHLVAFQILNRETFNFLAYDAAYNAAFPGGGFDPATGLPFPAGVYMPGYGPPLDYNTSGNPACAPGVPGPGALPAGCVLGGNPDVTPFLSGMIMPPLPAEQGWKDTAISYPGEVLRLIVRFAPTGLPITTAPADAWYEFDPNHGHGYVWHCHIIDHEDNEMMRPFSVFSNANAPVPRNFVQGIGGY